MEKRKCAGKVPAWLKTMFSSLGNAPDDNSRDEEHLNKEGHCNVEDPWNDEEYVIGEVHGKDEEHLHDEEDETSK
jgi:hypothetical protein